MNIAFLKGDATAPTVAGHKVIVHICNDIGRWGKGFVLAVSKRWPEPEQAYKRAFAAPSKPGLGSVQLIEVAGDITVANMVAQRSIQTRSQKSAEPPIRYEAVRQCLAQVAAHALQKNASVHMPRIGCGLAGGKWEQIEEIVQQQLVDAGLAVYVYDFE